MDYLYINATVKEQYRDLSCGCPFPAEYSQSMRSVLSTQDCLVNPQIPNVFTFFTLRQKGHAPVIVYASQGKHFLQKSVCKFTQCVGWTWDGKLLLEHMDDILSTGLYTEKEINDTALSAGTFALPKNRNIQARTEPLVMPNEVKQAILTTVMLRWLRYEDPLRIAVPENVDYDSYVRNAICQIYDLLPVTLRARAGFCSYMPSVKGNADEISIGFVPQKMADGKTLSLDGSSRAACNKLNCGTNNAMLDQFIGYLAQAEDSTRRDLLEELFEDVEGSGNSDTISKLSTTDFQTVGEALYLLTWQGPVEKMLPQLRKFYENTGKCSQKMRQRVHDRISSQEWIQSLEPLVQNQFREKPQEIYDILASYRAFCNNNAGLSGMLWYVAYDVLRENNVSNTDIYNKTLAQRTKLTPIVNDGIFADLFVAYCDEQLMILRTRPTDTLAAVKQVMDKANALRAESNRWSSEKMPRVREEIQKLLEELECKRNDIALGELRKEFAELQSRPADSIEQIDKCLNEQKRLMNSAEESRSVPGVEDLISQIREYGNALEDRKAELVYRKLRSHFDALQAQDTKTVEDLKKCIQLAEKLLERLEKAPQTPKILDLKKEVEGYRNEKIREMNSSEGVMLKIRQIMEDDTTRYFDKLHRIGEEDRSRLKPEDLTEIEAALARKAPKTLDQYGQAFREYYQCPLNLKNVAKRPDFVCATIIRDVCGRNQQSLRCDGSAAKMAQQVEKAMHLAEMISEDGSVTVHYGGMEEQARWFRQLLCLSHTSKTAQDPRHLEQVLLELVRDGAFGADDLVPAVEMLRRCDMKYLKLFKLMMEGKFQDAREQQYLAAFVLIIEYTGKEPRGVLDAMQRVVDEVRSIDQEAEAAFRTLRKRFREPEKKKVSMLIPFVISTGVLVAVSIVAILLAFALKEKSLPEETVPTTVPIVTEATVPETEPPVVYPECFYEYAGSEQVWSVLSKAGDASDFATHRDRVTQFLDALEEMEEDRVLDWYYSAIPSDSSAATEPAEENTDNPQATDTEPAAVLPKTQVSIDDQGTTVSWDEYFFWLCWLHADDVSFFYSTPVQQLDGQVCGILQQLHKNVDSAQQAEDAALTAQDFSVETMKNAIVSAAAASFEAAQADMDDLALRNILFGSDFTRKFEEHAQLVAKMTIQAGSADGQRNYFLDHYHRFAGSDVIRFEGTDVEVTWDEYVFWECWLLANRYPEQIEEGTAIVIDGTTFDSLRPEVIQILKTIHALIPPEEYPSNLDSLLAAYPEESQSQTAAGNGEDAQTQEKVLLEEITNSARAAFEQARRIYQAIYDQVK